jgi:hypothetical protein
LAYPHNGFNFQTAKLQSLEIVIASEAKQSIARRKERMDCFVACAPLRKRSEFVAGNDGHNPAFSPRTAPEVCH